MLLNLTSPAIHSSLRTRANIAVARTVVVVLTVALAAFVGSALVGESFLSAKAKEAQQEVERSTLLLNAQGQASITETTKRLNTQISVLQKVQSRYVQWTPIIAKFSALTPKDITLHSIQFSQLTGKITFEATAKTREAYVAYEKILQGSELLTKVQFPLETKKVDINFTNSISLVGLPKP